MKMTVKLYGELIVIDDGKVICEDEGIKSFVEFALNFEESKPQDGYYYSLLNWYKDEIEVIKLEGTEEEENEVY